MVKFGKKEEKVHSYTPVEGRKDSFAHGLNFYKLFFIFMIGCVVGYCIEMLWCYLRLGYFESRQGLIYGPFSPVYRGCDLYGGPLPLPACKRRGNLPRQRHHRRRL